MMTSIRYSLSWCYLEVGTTVRRTLHSSKPEPCIEAARLIAGHPFVFNIELIETNTGEPVDWMPVEIGRVLVKGDAA